MDTPSFEAYRTITTPFFSETRNKLRMLDLEREIAGYAIRRFYEAGAEGKISTEERDNMSSKYRIELESIKEEIARGESILALSELERMQEEFVRLFSQRFDAINKRILNLRNIVGYEPSASISKKETKENESVEEDDSPLITKKESMIKNNTNIDSSSQQSLEKTNLIESDSNIKNIRKKISSSESEQGDAEKKVEEIITKVDNVLKKLGKMEAED